MANLTIGQKAERLLKLLLGLGNRRALSALQERGFRDTDMAEGWALLRSTALIRFDAVRPEASPSAVLEVDAWENRWFPVIDATLRRSFPEVHEKVLLNLSQTEGPPVILSVATLLERLDALRAATDPMSQAATEKLALRGVTPAVLDQVRGIITSVSTVSTTPAPPISEEEAERIQEENQAAMWAYYLEWSAIARSTIKDKTLLRVLGFSPVKRGKVAEEEDDDVVPPTQAAGGATSPATPSPTTSVTV